MTTKPESFMTHRIRGTPRLLVSMAAMLIVACHGSVTDSLLTATPPDIINPGSVNSADGATALRLGALARLRQIAGGTDGTETVWLFAGLLADEWTTSSTFIQNDEADERNISLDNSSVTNQYRTVNRARTAANQSIAALRKFLPTQLANIGEMYFVRGFAELTLADNFCNGTPLSDASGPTVVLGTPLTNDAVFRMAMASFDSALALSTGADDFSVSINRAAKIAKARAMRAINDYAGAATLVGGIPTSYSYDATFSTATGDNILWAQPASARRYNMGDTVVTTSAGKFTVKPSIPFGSANDPRLPVIGGTTKSQDGSVFSVTTTLWGRSTSIPVVSGVDARLIEAEAQLKAGNASAWLATLNALRATPPKLGDVQPRGLAPLVDPGTRASQVDLLFYEKAFWTFSRGQRLADVRRLIRQYGRAQETLLPVGAHYRGVQYGSDINLPVPTNELSNPNFKGCLDRKA